MIKKIWDRVSGNDFRRERDRAEYYRSLTSGYKELLAVETERNNQVNDHNIKLCREVQKYHEHSSN